MTNGVSLSEAASFDFFKQMPGEVCLEIISYLSVKDLFCIACVSKNLKSISTENSLWKKPLQQRYAFQVLDNGVPFKKIFKVLATHPKFSFLKSNFYTKQTIEKHPNEQTFHGLTLFPPPSYSDNGATAALVDNYHASLTFFDSASTEIITTVQLPNKGYKCSYQSPDKLVILQKTPSSNPITEDESCLCLFLYSPPHLIGQYNLLSMYPSAFVWNSFTLKDSILILKGIQKNFWNNTSSFMHIVGELPKAESNESVYAVVESKKLSPQHPVLPGTNVCSLGLFLTEDRIFLCSCELIFPKKSDFGTETKAELSVTQYSTLNDGSITQTKKFPVNFPSDHFDADALLETTLVFQDDIFLAHFSHGTLVANFYNLNPLPLSN